MRFGPDGMLYVSVGSSCNVCEEKDRRRAAMLRFRPDGSGEEIFATGLRNSVGFDWQPGTGELYATDNGRDLLGDDIPPCELNRIVQGGFYGWPFANGDRVPDPDFGAGHEREIAASLPPAHAVPRAQRAARHHLRARRARTRVAARRRAGGAARLLEPPREGRLQGRFAALGAGRPHRRARLRDRLPARGRRDRPPGRRRRRSRRRLLRLRRFRRVDLSHRAGHRRDGASGEPAPTSATATIVATDPLATLDPSERAGATSKGRALYEAHACFRCHEVERAEAGAVPVVMANLGRRYDVTSLATYLAAPQPPMPLFPLQPDERRDLAVFLLSEKNR